MRRIDFHILCFLTIFSLKLKTGVAGVARVASRIDFHILCFLAIFSLKLKTGVAGVARVASRIDFRKKQVNSSHT